MLDACVLYPAPLRDLLLSLAAAGLYLKPSADYPHSQIRFETLARIRYFLKQPVDDDVRAVGNLES